MIKYIVFVITIALFHTSNTSQRNVAIVISHDHREQESDSDTDSLCDVAISAFFDHKAGSPHRLKPYLKQIIKGGSHSPDGQTTIYTLQRIKSRDSFPELSEMLSVNELLFRAANKALDEREADLKKREVQLKEYENTLKKSVSKKIAAALTVGATSLTTIATVITTYYTK